MWEIIKSAFYTTFSVFFLFFGNLLISSFILFFFSRSSSGIFSKSFGFKTYIAATGWIGTPVHELGHAFFCLIFGHKITGVKLFSRNPTDGTLGYVLHSYNRKNIYHQIGNFFIGTGPIIFGSLVIYLLISWLLPNKNELHPYLSSNLFNFSSFSNFFLQLKTGIFHIISIIFYSSNFNSFKFWIFLYLTLAISCHMELSPPDIRTTFIGAISILVIILISQIIIKLLNTNTLGIIHVVLPYIHIFSGILIITIVLSACFCFSILILSLIYKLMR